LEKKPAFFFKPFTRILLVFLLVEAFLFTWAYGIRHLIPDFFPPGVEAMYKGVPRESNPWLEPWQRWDTPQYQAIAERGYSAFDSAYFSPPLYPFLMAGLAPVFGGNTLLSGLFISALTFLGCLLIFHKLALMELGNEASAMRTVIYMAAFPTAFFLVAAYNESLFLLAAMLCLYFLRREKWLAAGLMAGLAALTRLPGWLLVVPIGYAVWQAGRKGDRKGWFALAGIGFVLTGYYLYQWLWLGQLPTAMLVAQNQRGGFITFPGLNIIEAIQRISIGQLVVENSLELFFSLAFIVFTILVWKELPRVYGLYCASLMLFFLMRMGSPQPLVSMLRYTLEIFPVFLLFAGWGARPNLHRLILYLSVLGLLYFSAQFAIWGWVG